MDADEKLPSHCDVVVVGAGLAGLAAAGRLARAGLDVVVVESSDAPGGRIRTDMVDGFLIDRGFQVFNTAYPAAKQVLDYRKLDLKTFTKGALIRTGEGRVRLSDPRRDPRGLALVGSAVGRQAGAVGLARFGAMSARIAYGPVSRLAAEPERTTAAALAVRGIPAPLVDQVLRPFLSGVLLERGLGTSSRFFDLVWRTFVRGTVCVPARGMQAIPAQLAARLPARSIRYGTTVRTATPAGVTTDRGDVHARAVLVAAGPLPAAGLLGLEPPTMHGVTTFFHTAPRPPLDEPTLVLDGTGSGPVVNTVVLTAAAPSYSADGRPLIATSTLEQVDEATVRAEAARLYGVDTDRWQLVSTVEVPHALPAAPPPLGDLRRPVRLADGRYVAGDHRDTPSIQGALVSGRRAATAILEDLRP